jgi:hypothetical protein
MDYLGVVAIVKDEDLYLPEWIAYYRMMGATHFWIYDNDSKVPVAKSISKLNHGDIVAVPFPGRARQIDAYNHALSFARGKVTWLAVIDVDEYIIPKKAMDLCDLLKDYENYGGLAINWQMFGPSGHKTKPSGLQIEAYKKRNKIDAEVNRHVKMVVRPERVEKGRDPHSMFFKDGFYAVNEKKILVEGSFSAPVSTEIVQINHYFTRTTEEYKVKISKGDPNGAEPKDMRLFEATERDAVEDDVCALKFASHLRAVLYNDRVDIS